MDLLSSNEFSKAAQFLFKRSAEIFKDLIKRFYMTSRESTVALSF